MAVRKILLDDDLNEDFSLLAIHCSEEDYKVAYSLNKYLNLRLQRQETDLFLSQNEMEVSFPIFQFEDLFQYTTYYLVGNKCKTVTQSAEAIGGLFDGGASERTLISYLLPEFKNADFFLKIESDFESIPLRKNLAIINEIKQVISAYEIQSDQIKSYNNLIFS
ncbi:MAG: IPExxxVDY family protein [Bacteroidota bacterium]